MNENFMQKLKQKKINHLTVVKLFVLRLLTFVIYTKDFFTNNVSSSFNTDLFPT